MRVKTMNRIMMGLFILCLIIFIGSFYSCTQFVKNQGGVKGVIINVGKDIKDINEAIKEDKK